MMRAIVPCFGLALCENGSRSAFDLFLDRPRDVTDGTRDNVRCNLPGEFLPASSWRLKPTACKRFLRPTLRICGLAVW
jgi:hypothetical protein